MTMYLVHRNVDCLGPLADGVCESNYIVGIFDSEEKANAAKNKEIALAKEVDYEDQYDRHKTIVSIIPMEINKEYEGDDDQIYVGGGFYIT